MIKIEATPGYKISIGAPVTDCISIVAEGHAACPIDPSNDTSSDDFLLNGNYLVTLEHNGVSVLYREPCTFDYDDDGEYWNLKINEDYEIFYTRYDTEMYISEQQNGDEIRLIIEPVEIELSDAFRAAVAEAIKNKMYAISGVLEPLAALPDSDGTYVMTCDVADGEAEITWESAE